MKDYHVIEICVEPLDIRELDRYSEKEVKKIGFKRSLDKDEQYEYAYDLELTSFRIPLEEIPHLIRDFVEQEWELFSASCTYKSSYHYHILYFSRERGK